MALLVLASLLAQGSAAAQVPVVLWHGMGDSCYNDFSMGRIEGLIADHLGEDAYVTSLCFGDNEITDSASGFLMESNKQVEKACRAIAEDENLKDGYHAVGFSQGGQFLRAVAQRCPSPPMKVLVSVGGQHQGVYGLPHCSAGPLCNAVRKLLSIAAYWPLVQDVLVQAQYWHDAHSPQRYRRGSTFLADINNDVADASQRDRSYAENLTKLDKLVLVRFNNDSMVVPRASSWFEFYAPGSTSQILPLEESAIYKEDWIGLKRLDESGRLVRLAIDGDHLRFSSSWLLSEIVDKYLRTAN